MSIKTTTGGIVVPWTSRGEEEEEGGELLIYLSHEFITCICIFHTFSDLIVEQIKNVFNGTSFVSLQEKLLHSLIS